MEPFNFNELPEVVRLLFEKVEHIEQIVLLLKPADHGEENLLSISEAADYLKISVAALYTKVSRKEVPYSKPGKRLYFSREELQQWVSNGKQKTAMEMRTEPDKYTKRFRSKLI